MIKKDLEFTIVRLSGKPAGYRLIDSLVSTGILELPRTKGGGGGPGLLRSWILKTCYSLQNYFQRKWASPVKPPAKNIILAKRGSFRDWFNDYQESQLNELNRMDKSGFWEDDYLVQKMKDVSDSLNSLYNEHPKFEKKIKVPADCDHEFGCVNEHPGIMHDGASVAECIWCGYRPEGGMTAGVQYQGDCAHKWIRKNWNGKSWNYECEECGLQTDSYGILSI